MRMMLTVQVDDTEAGNDAIEDGTLAQVIQETVDRIEAECAYFYTEGGTRTALMVFDMQDASEIPGISEPLFMGLNASVDFRPVMNAEELEAGLQAWAADQGDDD